MRSLVPLLVAAALVPAVAQARPKADLVIAWAPGKSLAPVEAAARDAGAAVIDRSPTPRPHLDTAANIKRGVAAFDALQLDDAARLLGDAKAEIDQTGAAELSETELSDLFLYRGLSASQRGDTTAAWDELVAATIVAPTRVLDPARFPPRVASELDRVRATLATRPKATLIVDVPTGCRSAIDGSPVSAPQPRLHGTHWVAVTCAAAAPWGTRVQLPADTTVVARKAPIAPPTADEMLIQARTAGARAFLVVELAGDLGVVRLVGADGRERDRRTVTVGTDLAPVAVAVRALLAPAPTERWYRSRWAWAAGAAVLAAAILIPITAAAASDSTPTTFSTKPKDPLPW
ncbi:hypothetical protein BH11MYX3_BH11MYX3_14030 [soil metagenome]